jgi:hypothetical protein
MIPWWYCHAGSTALPTEYFALRYFVTTRWTFHYLTSLLCTSDIVLRALLAYIIADNSVGG